MKNLEIPLGDYKFAQVTMNQYVHVDGKVICNVVKRFKKETEAIGILIADAGNTAQKCGLLPSELLQQRDELREALTELSGLFEYLHGGAIVGKSIRQRAIAAIKNTESSQKTEGGGE